MVSVMFVVEVIDNFIVVNSSRIFVKMCFFMIFFLLGFGDDMYGIF